MLTPMAVIIFSEISSKRQCEEGRLFVESGVDFLKNKGINSTPIYIFSDGLFHTGLLQLPDLLKRLESISTPDLKQPAQ